MNEAMIRAIGMTYMRYEKNCIMTGSIISVNAHWF